MKFEYANNMYGSYAVPAESKNRPCSKRILSGGVWEPGTLETIQSLLVDGDLIHAGAYFGDFLPALSQMMGEGRIVRALEPSSDNYEAARETIRMNNLENVNLLNSALGHKNTYDHLVTAIPGSNLGGASTFYTDCYPQSMEKVLVRTIDSLTNQRPISLIHLDLEGSEMWALKGAERTLSEHHPAVIFERNETTSFVEKFLESIGYSKSGAVYNNLIYVYE